MGYQKFKELKKNIDNCYLAYVEGYLTCTYNHKAGEECLMHETHAREYKYENTKKN